MLLGTLLIHCNLPPQEGVAYLIGIFGKTNRHVPLNLPPTQLGSICLPADCLPTCSWP
jgi:hypothetical protein